LFSYCRWFAVTDRLSLFAKLDIPITWRQSIREKSGLYFSLLLKSEFTYLEF
jgi:hypothetical protein